MASIAYVTDKDMMEYHRLHENKAINFWRPGTKRNISNLQKGDLIFFLAKTAVRKRERGIIGYGIFKEQKIMGAQKMWNQFQTLNGYEGKEELYRAIERMSKDKKVPKDINSLWIEEIIFFQSPIFLSEFGLKISNRIESYMYVDREDPELTNKILRQAQEIGVDMWSSVAKDKNTERVINQTRISYLLAEIYSRVKLDLFSEAEERKMKKETEQLKKSREFKNYDVIKGSQYVLVRTHNKHIDVQFSFLSPIRKSKEKLITLVGQISLFVELLNGKVKDCDVHAGILLYSNIQPELEELLEEAHIRYHYPKFE